MNIDFTNKTVLVTGGTRGIGASIVRHFENLNAEVIATGVNKDQLHKSINRRVKYHYLDLKNEKSISDFIEYISQRKKIDVLINNAGMNKIDPIEKIKDEDWNNIYSINLYGPFVLTREISKIMKKNKYGRIVNIASIFGVISREKRAAYSSTKSGLIGLTKATAHDLAKDNILVNSISPGFINTELTKNILGEKSMKEISSSIPLKRLGDPDEIAKLVLFLTSDQNTYITGENIIIDGGYTIA
jgi:3-oxoacyl-[acyl-carrier protein] reductase|tara:strand:+ start:1195 stop:1926 length:732 start_codon:yes stop_codon:yes gene_type:complete